MFHFKYFLFFLPIFCLKCTIFYFAKINISYFFHLTKVQISFGAKPFGQLAIIQTHWYNFQWIWRGNISKDDVSWLSSVNGYELVGWSDPLEEGKVGKSFLSSGRQDGRLMKWQSTSLVKLTGWLINLSTI